MFPFQNRTPRFNENVPFRWHPPPSPDSPGQGWMMPHRGRPFRPNFPQNNSHHSHGHRPNYRFEMSSTSLENTSNSNYFHHQHNQMYSCQYQDHCSITVTYSSYANPKGCPNPNQNQIFNNIIKPNQIRPPRHGFSNTLVQKTATVKKSSEHCLGRDQPKVVGKSESLNKNKDKGEETPKNRKDSSLDAITFGSFEDIAFQTGKGVGPEMPGEYKSEQKENFPPKNNNFKTNNTFYQDGRAISNCVTKHETENITNFKNVNQTKLNKPCNDFTDTDDTGIDSNFDVKLVISSNNLSDENLSDTINEEDEKKNYTEFSKRLDTHGSNDREENSDDDKTSKENDDQFSSQGETDNNSEEPEEQRKFTKSYWRKQRRLRLKERLLAEKALMENDPNYIPEQRESSKDPKNTKSKAIDYDLYLPAHVLMHVKRDLVSVLMEFGQTREVKVTFEDMERSGPHHASRFHTAAVVDEETFPVGSGSSKKMAKKAAAAHALKIMYDRGRSHLDGVNETANLQINRMRKDEIGSHAHKILLVSRHVLQTVEETQFINYSKDKICATFVLEHNNKMRVVGLGTGNRCILYQHMTNDGLRVLHAHAEIMARRAFMRFLYNQLLGYQANKPHPLFTRSETGKLKLRDKFQVHLYISRPPCGDAAAFPTISNFPNKMRAIRKQGQLRTIIDDGEGAIPTDFEVPAGPNGKERLRIMTCSDKICRWNVLGVQGALLSHYIDPIYLNSLVIGSHTGDQQGHVPRAVSGRLKCGRLHEVIQRPYRINSPEIHYPIDELADEYNITKSKQYCITWALGDHDAEILDAITGVANMEPMDNPVPSRVAKTSLFDLFKQVCNKFGRGDLGTLDYSRAKKSAATFQRMKCFVGQHLAAMGFGQWYSLHQTYGTDSFPCPEQC